MMTTPEIYKWLTKTIKDKLDTIPEGEERTEVTAKLAMAMVAHGSEMLYVAVGIRALRTVCDLSVKSVLTAAMIEAAVEDEEKEEPENGGG